METFIQIDQVKIDSTAFHTQISHNPLILVISTENLNPKYLNQKSSGSVTKSSSVSIRSTNNSSSTHSEKYWLNADTKYIAEKLVILHHNGHNPINYGQIFPSFLIPPDYSFNTSIDARISNQYRRFRFILIKYRTFSQYINLIGNHKFFENQGCTKLRECNQDQFMYQHMLENSKFKGRGSLGFLLSNFPLCRD